jgi:chromosomal replication initiation ATPase DnaA
MRWPNWPGPVLYLFGPPASGKSKLAGEWARLSGGARLQASNSVPVDHPDRVVIEDLEDLGDEAALFHLINDMALGGGSLLLTARVPPSGLAIGLPDLRTRLRAAPLAEIGAPDEVFLEELLVLLAARAQLALEPAVASYCVTRMERTQLAAVNLISALDRRSLAEGRKVSLKLAAEVLGEEGR